MRLIKPKYLRIGGYWYPRGGMPIDVFWQTGKIAEGRLGARPGRRALSRPRLDFPDHTFAGAGRRSQCAQVKPTPTITAAPITKTGVM